MPEPLTKLERRILDYLIDYVRRNTYQPSIREIGKRFDIKSTKTVSEYLQALADKGWIERDPSRSRGVRLLGVDLQPETVTVPWYAGLAPDGPALDGEAVVDEFQLDRDIAGASGSFLLGMRGSSLEGMGIHDGDMLLVEPVSEAELEDDDVLVARADGEALVKRFQRRGGEMLLDTASQLFPATVVRKGDDLVVVGRVVAVFRRLRTPVAAGVSPDHSGREAMR